MYTEKQVEIVYRSLTKCTDIGHRTAYNLRNYIKYYGVKEFTKMLNNDALPSYVYYPFKKRFENLKLG